MEKGAENTNTGLTVTLDENGFIPGTTYKSVDDLLKGHTELKGLSDRQGQELGNLRKDKENLSGQAQTLASLLKENLTKEGNGGANKGGNDAATPDYVKEIATAKAELKKLDPVDENFAEKQAELVDKIADLRAAAQHQTTLKAAGELFQSELSERDVKAAQDTFHRENPTFRTPEMQTRIKEKIAGDKTGMLDPYAAFREIERDDALAAVQTLTTENTELKKRLDLAKGTENTGKVIVKGQNAGRTDNTKQTKATGKDLDAGMMTALRKSRGEE